METSRTVTERRNSDASAASVTKELATLKHFLSYCVGQELIEFNPASGVKGPKAPPPRVRYLQPRFRWLIDPGAMLWV